MISENLVENRRQFHKVAETGWLEFETTIKILENLEKYDFELYYGKSIHSSRIGLPDSKERTKHSNNILTKYKNIDNIDKIDEILSGYTGVIARLDTKISGPNIGLRFDIDANNIKESNSKEHSPYLLGYGSINDGAMHACGHDGHISIGLEVCKWISKNKKKLSGIYTIIFQPAEEGVRGAQSIVKKLKNEKFDYFISGHLGLGMPSNTIGLGTVGFLATKKYDVILEGKAAHAGANPEEGKNALLGAASASLILQSFMQHSEGIGRLNVGKLNAGTGRNIIPSKAFLEIESRGENENIISTLDQKIYDVFEGVSKSYDLDTNIEIVGSAPAFNYHNAEFIKLIKEYLEENKSVEYVIEEKFSLGGSEDVTYFMEKTLSDGGEPIHMIWGSDLNGGHHNELFNFNENDLYNAFESVKNTILFLNKTKE